MIVTLTSGGDFAPAHVDIMMKVLDDESIAGEIVANGDILIVMTEDELEQLTDALKAYEEAVYN